MNKPAPLRHKRLKRMKKRGEFQRLTASPSKFFTPSMVIQTAQSRESRDSSPENGENPKGMLGFTASRKVGNAVTRNRAKRRLRAASDVIMSGQVRGDWDYVLVARTAAATRPWSQLLADLSWGLRKLHAFDAVLPQQNLATAKSGSITQARQS